MKKPLILLIISIAVFVFSTTLTPYPKSYKLKKIEEDQKMDLGEVTKGNYHFYARWVFNGDTVGSTPADIEITNTTGTFVATHMESNNDDTTSSFSLTDKDQLKATVRILSTESVDGADAELILAQEKSLPGFYLFLFSGLGIIVALVWFVKSWLTRKSISKKDNE